MISSRASDRSTSSLTRDSAGDIAAHHRLAVVAPEQRQDVPSVPSLESYLVHPRAHDRRTVPALGQILGIGNVVGQLVRVSAVRDLDQEPVRRPVEDDLNASGEPSLILITGHADWLDGETAKSLKGKALFLPKPLNIEQLIEQVNRP